MGGMFRGGNEELEKPRSEVRKGRGKAKSHLGQNTIKGDVSRIKYVRENKAEGMGGEQRRPEVEG